MYNKKMLIGILLSGILLVNLTGCDNEDKKITEQVKLNKTQNNLYDSQISEEAQDTKLNQEITNVEQVEETKTEEKVEIPNDNGNSVNEENIQNLSKDEIVINYFNEATQDINNFLESEKVETAKAKCKEYFITFVDFIFYNGTIKNVTFAELKDSTKKQVITLTQKLDALIMKKFPNYKETIGETSKNVYEKASDLLNSGKENLEDYIISKVGEDKYQDILDSIEGVKENDKQTWNDVKDTASDLYESGKEKVKNWYENFRGN